MRGLRAVVVVDEIEE